MKTRVDDTLPKPNGAPSLYDLLLDKNVPFQKTKSL